MGSFFVLFSAPGGFIRVYTRQHTRLTFYDSRAIVRYRAAAHQSAPAGGRLFKIRYPADLLCHRAAIELPLMTLCIPTDASLLALVPRQCERDHDHDFFLFFFFFFKT